MVKTLSALLASFLLFTGLAFSQAFPGSVVTNATIPFAVDHSTTTLSTTITSSSTTITVASSANFAAFQVINIDSEQIQICSVSINILNVCLAGRGYFGTTAAAHSLGANVFGYVNAGYHNTQFTETAAIENWLINTQPAIINTNFVTNNQTLPAFLPSGTGAVIRTNQSKLRDTVSVKDFGAIGNGVTDDQPAFAAAFASLDTSTGGKLLVPCGNYLMGTPWTIPLAGPIARGMITVVEGNSGCSIISGTGHDIVKVLAQSGDGVAFLMRDLMVQESNPSGNSSTVGIELNNSGGIGLDNVSVVGALDQDKGIGLLINGNVCGSFNMFGAASWNHGVEAIGIFSANDCNQFYGSKFYRNNYGLYVTAGEVNLSQSTVYDNAITGLYCSTLGLVMDNQVHYENGGVLHDVDIESGGSYQSTASSYVGSGFVSNGVGNSLLFVGANNSVVVNSTSNVPCIFTDPKGFGVTVTGTGNCMYRDGRTLTFRNFPSNYTMDLDGQTLNLINGTSLVADGVIISHSSITGQTLNTTGTATVGNLAATTSVTGATGTFTGLVSGSGFKAGASTGVTNTFTCTGGQHVNSLTIVGGIITATPGCS